jgi:hypothetical protein
MSLAVLRGSMGLYVTRLGGIWQVPKVTMKDGVPAGVCGPPSIGLHRLLLPRDVTDRRCSLLIRRPIQAVSPEPLLVPADGLQNPTI